MKKPVHFIKLLVINKSKENSMKTLQFVVAMVKFVILVIKFIPKIILNLVKEKKNGRRGVITNLKYNNHCLSLPPRTIFEVHDLDGNIFHLGFKGHVYEISEGDTIHFWKSGKSVATHVVTKNIKNNGIPVILKKTIKYYGIKKYQIINEDEELGMDDATFNIAN